MPIVIPTFTKIWKSSANDEPARDDGREWIACERDDAQTAPDDEQVEHQQESRAEEAALLGERREHEVGVMLRQEVERRLRRVVDAAAAELAGSDRVLRLRDVVGRPAGILGGLRKLVSRSCW